MRAGEYTDQQEITCPFCGYKDANSWESGMNGGDEHETHCKRCEKPFSVSCEVTRTFSSSFVGAVHVQDETFPRGA